MGVRESCRFQTGLLPRGDEEKGEGTSRDNIPLSDGLAYMVANEPYQKHIAQAADNKEVCIIGP